MRTRFSSGEVLVSEMKKKLYFPFWKKMKTKNENINWICLFFCQINARDENIFRFVVTVFFWKTSYNVKFD